MAASDVFIGIDPSEGELVIGAHPQKKVWRASNETWGLTELVKRLAALRPRVVVIESSRGMERPVQSLLEEAGLSVIIVSHSLMRDFVRARGSSMNGVAHSMALAEYGRSVALETSSEKKTSELGSLLMRRGQLMEMLVTEKNRRETVSKQVRFNVEAHIGWLEKCLHAINGDIAGFVRKLPIWSQQKRPIKVVPGAGPVWGIALLASLALWAIPGIS